MKKHPAVFFAIAFSVLVFDQVTKYLVKNHVSPYDVIRLLPFFNIVYAENVGSAFGMFKSLGNAFFMAVAAVAIVLVMVLIIKDRANAMSFSLVLGGAAGNLSDRIIYGYVIDFLDVHAGGYHWPAFNVADSALTIGIALMAYKIVLPDLKRLEKNLTK